MPRFTVLLVRGMSFSENRYPLFGVMPESALFALGNGLTGMAWREGRKRAGGSSLDVRLTPQDRTGGPVKGRADTGRRRRDSKPSREPKKRKSGKGRSGFGRIIYWGFVLALWGADRRHRRAGLDRHPSAADRVARNTEASPRRPHPRRKRRDARHARRHGRRCRADERIAGLRAERFRRHRGSPLLFAFRHRPVRHHARHRSPTFCAAAPRKAARR